MSRDADGLVRIAPAVTSASPAPSPDESLFEIVLSVAGGVLTVDVRRPQESPTALLFDPDLAQAWVSGVYGSDVATEVAKYADDPDYRAQWRDFAARDYLSDVVGRIGEASWLHRWWPAGWVGLPELDEDLLEVEISGMAWLAQSLFSDMEHVRHLLAPQATLAAAQLQALLKTDTSESDAPAPVVTGAELRVFSAAVEAVVDLVDSDAPGSDACRDLLQDPRLRLALDGSATEVLAAVPWLRAMAARARSLAAAAGGFWTPELAYEGTRGAEVLEPPSDVPFIRREVDWALVPPRMVSMDDPFANLTYRTVGESAAPVLEVVVPAAANYTPTGRDSLFARAYDDSDVPVTFPLEFQPGEGDGPSFFVGSRRLFAPAEGDLVVDVFSPVFVQRPRPKSDASARVADEILARVTFLLSRLEASSDSISLTEQAMRVAEQD